LFILSGNGPAKVQVVDTVINGIPDHPDSFDFIYLIRISEG
jgi:hypothetical protein